MGPLRPAGGTDHNGFGPAGSQRPFADRHFVFVFQLISCLIDIGRGTLSADRGFIRFATFPHLIAGPIVRYSDIEQELFKRSITTSNVGLGIQFFIVGLCQKALIANIVAPAADKVFGLSTSELSAAIAWIGVTAYTLQIYFDFCG